MPVAAPCRRSNRDEHGFGASQPLGQIRRERQTPCRHVAGHQVIQARLENRHLAVLQSGNFTGVFVDTGYFMAEIREANAGHKPDIPRADHGNTHGNPVQRCSIGSAFATGPGRAQCPRHAWRLFVLF